MRELRIRDNNDGLDLGLGTVVHVRELRSEPIGPAERETQRTRLTATLTLAAEVGVVTGKCAICGTPTPPLDEAAIWFVLQHHDGPRLVFAGDGDMEGERDAYPVAGWRYADGQLRCAECVAELEAAQEAAKQRRRAKR